MRLRRRWQTWMKAKKAAYEEFQLRRAREHRERRQAKERDRMEAEATKLALARSMLERLDQDYVEALKQAVAEELRAEVYPNALEEARAALEETFTKRKEQLEDTFARYKEVVDDEVEDRISHGIEVAQTEFMTEMEDRLQELREARNEAREQRDQAERMLLHLLRQLLDERGRYLRNANIQEFDQYRCNLLLRKHGWRIRSRATFSERNVRTQIGEAHWQSRSVFRLEAVPPEGVLDVDNEGDESNIGSDNATAPDRLALPESAGA